MIWLWLACAGDTAPGVMDVDPVATDGGHSASVWVQGNSAFLEGAEVCREASCEQVGEDGFAHLGGLPSGPVAIRVDHPGNQSLLIPLDLNNNWVARWAARSLSDWVYEDWLGAGTWEAGTGMVSVFAGDLSSDGGQTLAGVELEVLIDGEAAGEAYVIDHFTAGVPGHVTTDESLVWFINLPPGEVTLAWTAPEGWCNARSMGWEAQGDSVVVPVEADRETSVQIQCVEKDY